MSPSRARLMIQGNFMFSYYGRSLLIGFFVAILYLSLGEVRAQSNYFPKASGCCSYHGGESGRCSASGYEICNDGTQSPSCRCTPTTYYTLSVSKGGSGSGTIVGNGISCGGDCTETFLSNTIVTLTASPNSGNTFTGWTGACTNVTGACVVTMTSSKTVSANFSGPQSAHTVTVKKTGNGTGKVTGTGIDCGLDCSETYSSNTKVSLIATPDAESSFAGWNGACTNKTGPCLLTVDAAKTVYAQFERVSTSAQEPSGTVNLTSTGACANDFYIAEATLAPGAKTGMWGMEVKLSSEPRELTGGFNLGGAFDANGRNPGFGAFSLSSSQQVTFKIYAQPLAGPIELKVELLKDNTSRIAGVQGTPQTTAPLSFSANLAAGFYVVQISSTPSSGQGTFQLELSTGGSFAGGVVVGGYLARSTGGASLTGFGAFCLPKSQPVLVKLYGHSQYGEAAAGDLVLKVKDNKTPRNVLAMFGADDAAVKSNQLLGGTWSFTYTFGATYVDTFRFYDVIDNIGANALTVPYHVRGTNKYNNSVIAGWDLELDKFVLTSKLSTSFDIYVFDFTSLNEIRGGYYFDSGWGDPYSRFTLLTGIRAATTPKLLDVVSEVFEERMKLLESTADRE